MTTRHFAPIVAALMLTASLFSCNDNNIGSSITDTILKVVVDSSFTVTGKVVENSELPARTITKMLGVIKAENYGELSSDVVTQFMPTAKIDTTGVTIDDIDSCKFVFDIPAGKGRRNFPCGGTCRQPRADSARQDGGRRNRNGNCRGQGDQKPLCL